MKTLLLLGWVGALLFAALTYPLAGLLAGGAVEAYIISGKDPSAIALEQEIFEAPKGAGKESKAYRDAVMGIYGSQTDEPTRVVFVSKDKFVHPKELPTLTLLPVDKQKGENPFQVKTLYFLASRTCMGASVVAGALFLLWIWARRRGAPSPSAGAAPGRAGTP